jgi:hypothetical protein
MIFSIWSCNDAIPSECTMDVETMPKRLTFISSIRVDYRILWDWQKLLADETGKLPCQAARNAQYPRTHSLSTNGRDQTVRLQGECLLSEQCDGLCLTISLLRDLWYNAGLKLIIFHRSDMWTDEGNEVLRGISTLKRHLNVSRIRKVPDSAISIPLTVSAIAILLCASVLRLPDFWH